MARFNEILQARYNRFLQRLLSMKGGPVAAQLGSEVGPTLQLDDADNLENRFQVGWRSYGGWGNGAAGGAGNRSAVQLFNPAASNVVAVIEKISIVSGGADLPQLQRGAPSMTNFTAGVGQGSRDIRIPNTMVSSCLLKTSVNAGAFAGFNVWAGGFTAASQYLDVITTIHDELVLMPGDFYTVAAASLNTGITVAWFWRERVLEEGEVPGL